MRGAIAPLIDRKLVSVFGGQTDDRQPVFAQQAEEELSRRQSQACRHDEKVTAAEERLRAWEARLRTWAAELETRERRVSSQRR